MREHIADIAEAPTVPSGNAMRDATAKCWKWDALATARLIDAYDSLLSRLSEAEAEIMSLRRQLSGQHTNEIPAASRARVPQ